MTVFDLSMLIVGIIAIVIGCVGKSFYYAKSLTGVSLSDKRAPTWLGRAMFMAFGVLVLAIELKHLFLDGK